MTEGVIGRDVPSATIDAIIRAVHAGLQTLKAVTPLRLADWAAKSFLLSGDSSHRKGQWESWPFQIGWMDAFSNDDIEQVDVKKGKRVGYTKTLVAFIGYNAAHRHRKQAMWQPTDDDRDSFVKSEVDPMIEEVPAVSSARRMAKGAEDTIRYKTFLGSVAHFLGGKAARAYRRITVAVAELDEIDGFDQQVEKSADPVTLARGRLEGAPFPKLVVGSTPRIKGLSHIERQVEQADVRMVYNIPCPQCDAEHPLLWGGKDSAHGFKWSEGIVETVTHVCPHCHEPMTQGDYLRTWEKGAWVCEITGIRYGSDRVWRTAEGELIRAPRHVAFDRVWAAYSPQREWSDIVREFLGAKKALETGDTGPMQGWVNETRAETWEIVGDRTEEHALEARSKAETPLFDLKSVQDGCHVLTAGIDLQGNRWEIGVWGWGAGLESWTIDHHVIEGNPADERDWEMVESYLRSRFGRVSGAETLGIEAVSIDSGHYTQAVYNWARTHTLPMRVSVVKGASEEGKPIKGTASSQEVNWRGQKWRNGVKLWVIGVDTAKDLLHGQLQIAAPGPGYVHFSHELKRGWFDQLTAEQRILVRGAAGEGFRWVKRRPRNEVLDCRNYALHSAYMLDLHRVTNKRWQQIAAQPKPQPKAEQPSAAPVQPAARAPIRPSKPSFQRAW